MQIVFTVAPDRAQQIHDVLTRMELPVEVTLEPQDPEFTSINVVIEDERDQTASEAVTVVLAAISTQP